MANNKYISTKDAVRLTGLSTQEIYDLIHSGKLPARKAPKSGWRMTVQDLTALGLIQEGTVPTSEEITPEEDEIVNTITYIADDEHFTEVFKRMTEVEHDLKIATGDLKNFRVQVESEDEDVQLRLCDFFMSLVERGVHVQIVCMKPFNFYLYAKNNRPELLEHPLFELRCNEHNHMKLFIFDDETAYIGSANITAAAIGKRERRRRNHEAGILLMGPMIQEPLHHFEKVWNDPDILKHTWKRFASMAREHERDQKEKYGE